MNKIFEQNYELHDVVFATIMLVKVLVKKNSWSNEDTNLNEYLPLRKINGQSRSKKFFQSHTTCISHNMNELNAK